jgi:hypothetical protein
MVDLRKYRSEYEGRVVGVAERSSVHTASQNVHRTVVKSQIQLALEGDGLSYGSLMYSFEIEGEFALGTKFKVTIEQL